MGDVEQADVAEVHRRRRADQANGIDRDLRAVDGDRPNDAHVYVEAHDRHVRIDQRVVQARRKNLLGALGTDAFRQHALVLVVSGARALAFVERGVAGPAVAIAGDVALAVLPRRGGLLLLGLDHGCALAVAFAARELDALLVDGRGMAERHMV